MKNTWTNDCKVLSVCCNVLLPWKPIVKRNYSHWMQVWMHIADAIESVTGKFVQSSRRYTFSFSLPNCKNMIGHHYTGICKNAAPCIWRNLIRVSMSLMSACMQLSSILRDTFRSLSKLRSIARNHTTSCNGECQRVCRPRT